MNNKEIEILSLLSSDITRVTLEILGRKKKSRLHGLRDDLVSETGENIDLERTKRALRCLMEENLVEERQAKYEDRNWYYLTTRGMKITDGLSTILSPGV